MFPLHPEGAAGGQGCSSRSLRGRTIPEPFNGNDLISSIKSLKEISILKFKMEIIPTDHKAYAYTIKRNCRRNDPNTKEHYVPFFDRLKKLNIGIEYKVLEKDKRGRLHYHGILYLKKGFYRKRLMMDGLHLKLKEIYDKSGWVKYIHKDCEYHDLEAQADECPDTPIDDEYTVPTYNMFIPFNRKHNSA